MTTSYHPGSVTEWIEELRNNEPDASGKIWARFADRLTALARKWMRNSPCVMNDGDDVVAAAFTDFFRRGPSGFARLIDRNDLWQILVQIADCRAKDFIRHETTKKNGEGKVVTESAIRPVDSSNWMDSVPGRTSAPDLDLIMVEAFEERLADLPTEYLRQIALAKLDDLGNATIAEMMGTSLRSVERRLKQIREIWERQDSRDAQ